MFDSKNFYIPLGEEVTPLMVDRLKYNIFTYERSLQM
jgi:hypothetical protein